MTAPITSEIPQLQARMLSPCLSSISLEPPRSDSFLSEAIYYNFALVALLFWQFE
jgi:hypothetical protein